MSIKALKIFAYLLVSFICLFVDDYKSLSVIYFYFLFINLIIDLFIDKKVTLLTVWNFSFLYVIIAEAILTNFLSSYYYLLAFKFLIIANNIVNIGYLSSIFKKSKPNLDCLKLNRKYSGLIFLVFMILLSFFFFTQIERALYIYAVGRNVAYSEGSDGLILGELIKAIGFVLPAIMTYYYFILRNKSIFFPIILSLPIILILFLGGTRFPLLFAVLGIIIVYISKVKDKISFKNYLFVGILLASLGVGGVLMKQLRSSVTKDQKLQLVTYESKDFKLHEYLASFMTNEGVINATSGMISYFETNEHMYGTSSSFLLYFWIPRSIWPEKPTMLGYWLIRETSSNQYGNVHSASYGFTGDLFADFGWFSLIIVFFIGRLLFKANQFKDIALKSKNFSVIIGAMLYPYTFFFVRSPITATMNFIGIIIIYYLMKRLIFK